MGSHAVPFPQKGHSPHFSAHVYCGKMARWMKMPLDTEIGLGSGHIVLDGKPVPFPQKGHSPHFSAHVYCGKTARWMKMPLDTELGLAPGPIVRWGFSSPRKGAQPPIFGSCLLWPNGRTSQLLLSTCSKCKQQFADQLTSSP